MGEKRKENERILECSVAIDIVCRRRKTESEKQSYFNPCLKKRACIKFDSTSQTWEAFFPLESYPSTSTLKSNVWKDCEICYDKIWYTETNVFLARKIE